MGRVGYCRKGQLYKTSPQLDVLDLDQPEQHEKSGITGTGPS